MALKTVQHNRSYIRNGPAIPRKSQEMQKKGQEMKRTKM